MIAYSKHFLEQIELRGISTDDVNDVVTAPENILIEDGLTVYQKKRSENNKQYWLRIFVNNNKQPPLAVTAYKTSKISKYTLP